MLRVEGGVHVFYKRHFDRCLLVKNDEVELVRLDPVVRHFHFFKRNRFAELD